MSILIAAADPLYCYLNDLRNSEDHSSSEVKIAEGYIEDIKEFDRTIRKLNFACEDDIFGMINAGIQSLAEKIEADKTVNASFKACLKQVADNLREILNTTDKLVSYMNFVLDEHENKEHLATQPPVQTRSFFKIISEYWARKSNVSSHPQLDTLPKGVDPNSGGQGLLDLLNPSLQAPTNLISVLKR